MTFNSLSTLVNLKTQETPGELMLPETITALIVYILQVFPADRELLADFRTVGVYEAFVG